MIPLPHHLLVDKLARTLDLAGTWLDELPGSLPADDRDAGRRWSAPTVDAVADKVVAEIATLAHVAVRVTDGAVTAALRRLRPRLEHHGRPGRHLDLMRRAPQFAWPLGIVHAILTAQGSTDARYDAVLASCLATGWNAAVDRPAFRAMEPRWAQAVWRQERPHTDDLWPQQGWRQLPSFLARREDAYALTHAVLYGTDFGRYRAPAQAPDPARLAPVLDAYLAERLWADDLDLVGEIALAALCVAAPCRYLTTAVSVLFGSWRGDVVRGPGLPAGSDPPADRVFATCYHTTLVAGLVAAGLLCMPYPGTLAEPQPRKVARGTLELLSVSGPEPEELAASWTVLVDDVPDLPEAVLGLVRDGAVAHACRHLRQPALRALLPGGEATSGRATAPGPVPPDASPSLTIRQARTWLALLAGTTGERPGRGDRI